jgi:glycosyltransferase involved in cell wall biosynthesis
MDKKDILLSVIIPCKNEANNIARCLSSVLADARNFPSYEIIVVDSNSSDDSVEKAKKFDVDIIKLQPGWDIAAASARYVGCLKAQGKYWFFIDADMQLFPGFLKKAIDFLEINPNVAAVAGLGHEFYLEGGKLENMYGRKPVVSKVDYLGGAALFRKQALKKVGYFNPFLKAEEEHELTQRLKKARYDLYSIPENMISHYTTQKRVNFERRKKAGMYRGIGQMFSHTIRSGTFSIKYFLRYKIFIAFLAVLVGLLYALLIYLFEENHTLLMCWSGSIVLIWVVNCYSKRSIVEGTYSVYRWLAVSVNIFVGMFEQTNTSDEYPQDYIVIKKAGTI